MPLARHSNYDGSWTEWGNVTGAPIVKEFFPGLDRKLIILRAFLVRRIEKEVALWKRGQPGCPLFLGCPVTSISQCCGDSAAPRRGFPHIKDSTIVTEFTECLK